MRAALLSCFGSTKRGSRRSGAAEALDVVLLDRLLSPIPGAAMAKGVVLVALVASACVGTVGSDPTGGPGPAGGSPAGGGASPSPTVPGNGDPGPGNPASPGSPGAMPPPVDFPCTASLGYGYRTLRLLTREQYQRSVEDLLAVDFDVTRQLPPDTVSGSFVNNNDLSVLEGSYSGYLQVAERIAAWSAQRSFGPALGCGNFDQACAARFVDELAPRIVRRPLAGDERQAYLNVASGSATAGDVRKGIEVALAALLSSPQFIYRHELGERSPTLGAEVFELTPYEVATFLSYTFTGSTPDQVLLDAARNRALQTPEQIEQQAARLMNGGRTAALFKDLVHRWLGTANLEIHTKDPARYPGFAEIVPHMKAELSETFSHVMLQGGETFRSVFDPGYTFASAALARHYGIAGGGVDQVQKVPTTTRGGLLLSGAFLSKWAHPDEANPITRAVHVRRDFLCQDVPDPPPDVNISRTGKAGQIAPFLAAATTTNRMAVQRLTEDPACAACHSQVINPLGFGLEDYDTVANLRAVDPKGNAIDASGTLWSATPQLQLQQDASNADLRAFKGGKGLARLLTEDSRVSSLAKSCLAKQMLSFAMGVDARSIGYTDRKTVTVLSAGEKESYHCDVGKLVEVLSSGSPRRMLEKLATSSSVRYRKAWSR
jgi:hypothetical protein